jgi:hypothetical protein
MKRAALYFSLFALFFLICGCKKQESDADGIRAGINQHLAALKTLNLSAMDMSIQNVSIQGNQAQAQVEFRPKTGAPQGAAMQVSYSLVKEDVGWVVQNTQPAGGSIEHPAPGATGPNPHTGPTAPASASLPDFRNLVNSGSGSASALPPGHPPINSQASMPPQ